MENKNLKISLAIALTSACNLKCFYCKASGENLDKSIGTIDLSKMNKEEMVNSFKEIIKLFSDTKIYNNFQLVKK